jgi:hypothetical protein
MMKRIAIVCVLTAMAMGTSGCAAVVAGYLIGDGIQRSKQSDACHANIRETNAARIAKGQEPFPDTCS